MAGKPILHGRELSAEQLETIRRDLELFDAIHVVDDEMPSPKKPLREWRITLIPKKVNISISAGSRRPTRRPPSSTQWLSSTSTRRTACG